MKNHFLLALSQIIIHVIIFHTNWFKRPLSEINYLVEIEARRAPKKGEDYFVISRSQERFQFPFIISARVS